MMTLNQQRILITGATGNLGRQLIYECLRAGIKPVVLVRRESDTRYIDEQGLEKRIADLRNRPELEKAVAGMDIVIHGAAWVNFRQDKLTQFTGINTFGAIDLYRASAKAGVRRFVHLSSIVAVGARPRVTGEPQELITENWAFNLSDLRIPYIMTKRAAEEELQKLAQAGGPELVMLNPPVVVAPSRSGNDRAKAARIVSRWILPDLAVVMNLVDIRDVAPAILAAAERGRPGERYLLTGDNIVVRELALSVSAHFGSAPHLVKLPRWFLMGAARSALTFSILTGKHKVKFYPDLVRLIDYDWAYSHAKARAELGFSPRSIHSTLKDLLTNNFAGTWLKPR